MPFQLVVTAGPDSGRTFAVSEGTVFWIGRGSQSHTRLTDPHVSRMHCWLKVDRESLLLNDSRSECGTTVNGLSIDHATVHADDEIRTGQTVFRVQVGETPAECLPELHEKAVALESDTAAIVQSDTAIAMKLPPNRDEVPRSKKRRETVRDLTGRTVSGFRVLQSAGRTATSEVYEVVESGASMRLSLHVLQPHCIPGNEPSAFLRAVESLQPLQHENLTRVLNAGSTDSTDGDGRLTWYVTKRLEGHTLRSAARVKGVEGMLDWQNVWRVARHIATALSVVHEQCIVHRNVSPNSIFLPSTERNAKLTDFASARFIGEVSERPVALRRLPIGLLAYVAPERTVGRNADESSDLFSLGVTLYEFLTGRRPFDASFGDDLIEEIQTATPLPPRLIQLSIDDQFERIVLQLLEKDPAARFESASELAEELTGIGQRVGLRM